MCWCFLARKRASTATLIYRFDELCRLVYWRESTRTFSLSSICEFHRKLRKITSLIHVFLNNKNNVNKIINFKNNLKDKMNNYRFILNSRLLINSNIFEIIILAKIFIKFCSINFESVNKELPYTIIYIYINV